MDVKAALKSQYHGGFRMLRECVEVCPDDLWTAGKYPREFWKIAYHAVFYCHLYMGQNLDAFTPWHKHREKAAELWAEDAQPIEPNTKAELLEYIDHVVAMVDSTVDGLDLDKDDCGIPWYKNFPKLDHQILNVRHLQGHVGQLSELLFARDIETSWFSRQAPPQ